VFAYRISWRKITITSLTEVTAVSTANLRQERKKSLLLMLQKSFVCRPKIFLTNLTPSPGRPEKPGQIYKSAPCQKFHSQSSNCMTTQKYIWDWIKMHNGEMVKKLPSFTFNTKRMSNKARCDISAKQMFRTWMKTLLLCGFG